MDNKTFAIACNKLFFYSQNWKNADVTYPTLFNGIVTKCLPDFFLAFEPHLVEHLWGKFDSCYERYGCRGAFIAFYGELDGSNRARVLKWINENYQQSDDFGISLKMVE